jgi:hypothetical protein
MWGNMGREIWLSNTTTDKDGEKALIQAPIMLSSTKRRCLSKTARMSEKDYTPIHEKVPRSSIKA